MKYQSSEIYKIILNLANVIIDENLSINNYRENKLITLGFDSVAYIQLIVAIEKKFDMEFDDEFLSIGRIEYLSEFVDYILKKNIES